MRKKAFELKIEKLINDVLDGLSKKHFLNLYIELKAELGELRSK